MKSIFKWGIIIIVAFIFLYAFSSSYTSRNIDHLDYVIAIGFDTVENSDDLEISFEFANISSFSENSSSKDSSPIINTVVAPSLSSAVNLMNAYVGKHINLAHCKVIVFSEELASKGILDTVSSLINNSQIRPTANIIISKGKAGDYIENSVSSLEKVVTKYYDIFPSSSEYTGYTSNIILGEFYDTLISEDVGSVAILGTLSPSYTKNQSDSSSSNEGQSSDSSSEKQSNGSSETEEKNPPDTSENMPPDEKITKGDHGVENIGLCAFKNDKYLGDLTALETLSYSLIRDEVDNFTVTMDNPFDPNKKIDISVESLSSTNISVETKDNPIINIDINLTGKVLNGLDQLDFSRSDTLDKLNESLKKYLNDQILAYLNKTSKEFKSDLNGFNKYAKKNFYTISDFNDYNWSQKYENAIFNLNINSNIISSLLIQNS